MKAIHNDINQLNNPALVVVYPKDTDKWKQFTTRSVNVLKVTTLLCIPKILINESNSQLNSVNVAVGSVVVYPKDTDKWKQFTTGGLRADK